MRFIRARKSCRGRSRVRSTGARTATSIAAFEAGRERAAARSASSPGDRVATLAWNGYRHLELYYGVSGMGAVLHTINPRLFPEQITYIANHAEDQYLFFDLTFAPLIEKLGPLMTTVKGFVAMTDRAHMPAF